MHSLCYFIKINTLPGIKQWNDACENGWINYMFIKSLFFAIKQFILQQIEMQLHNIINWSKNNTRINYIYYVNHCIIVERTFFCHDFINMKWNISLTDILVTVLFHFTTTFSFMYHRLYENVFVLLFDVEKQIREFLWRRFACFYRRNP
jgi:hypothetical protein